MFVGKLNKTESLNLAYLQFPFFAPAGFVGPHLYKYVWLKAHVVLRSSNTAVGGSIGCLRCLMDDGNPVGQRMIRNPSGTGRAAHTVI